MSINSNTQKEKAEFLTTGIGVNRGETVWPEKNLSVLISNVS